MCKYTHTYPSISLSMKIKVYFQGSKRAKVRNITSMISKYFLFPSTKIWLMTKSFQSINGTMPRNTEYEHLSIGPSGIFLSLLLKNSFFLKPILHLF